MNNTVGITVGASVGATPTSRLTTSTLKLAAYRDVGVDPTLLLCCIFLLIWPLSATAQIFDWQSTEIQYLHGDGYQIPGNPNDVSRSIMTFSHADGWALGRNFFFMDTLISDGGETSQVNLYGELYSYLVSDRKE